ncbi:N-acetylmuramoyl-L-alanine amidase [Paramagnetospirillum kuznetsovii]|uniref:N-acetylmuramoyl-L-alanine amidase n=1 Tax=Paramagnetospirillum kuznetsovii TaxID=2053833 RepID=A0A364NYI1_9PROT|nr:N-acetylmuramoyl-L-alanine amidase [Paramagnetospirillum kuznetsovii]RAU22138.1 N-acetylmuramoyl-L-alanine amidase [Paramagnetospirillum kuznetsovii]
MTVISHPSPNFEPRRSAIVDMLVIHYTGMPDGPAALARLCDAEAKVSAHYLIEEDGRVFSLVSEDLRAWHAGASHWRGETDINSRSIGIELVNPGHEFGYRAFPDAQIAALVDLSKGIVGRHPIPARNVVGHSDIAPPRKQDPGELFPWQVLAETHGIGVWPCGEPTELPPEHVVLAGLAHVGYDIHDPKAALTAFQRHFRPWKVDGHLDAETIGRLRGLMRILR